MQKRLTGTIVARSGWAGLEALSSVLVSLVALLGIARLIGASEFGLGSLALGIVAIVGVVPFCLFPDALVQSPQITKQHFDSAWTATLLLSLVAVLVCMALAAPLAAFFQEPRFSAVFLSLSITLIPDGATEPLIAERRRQLDFRMAAIRRMAARSIGAACGVGCALAGLGVWSIVAQQWVTSVLGLMVMLIYSPVRPRLKLAFGDLKPMLRFSSSIVVTQFLAQLGPGLFLIYIGRVGDLTLAGYWALATRLAEILPRFFTQPVYHLALAHFARIQEQPQLLGQVVRGANAWLTTMISPAVVLIAVIGPDVLEFLVGEAWLPAGPAMQILAVGVMIRLRRLMDHVALNALSNSEVALWAYSFETAVIIAALFLLSPKTLVGVALLKAIQPTIGYCIIAIRSVEKTRRSAVREWWDLFLDLTQVAVIGVVIWCLHLFLIKESRLLVLVASPIVAMITAVIMMMVLRPAEALDAWSMLRAPHRPRRV
jgi:O-antigen/teichoic acid export membrane protein